MNKKTKNVLKKHHRRIQRLKARRRALKEKAKTTA